MSDRQAVVLVPGKINPRVLERLEGKVEIVTVPAGAEPVLPDGAAERINAIAVSGVVNAKWIDALPKLEIIANFGVGYDGVDAKHAATRGIVVTNTPDVLNDEVADTTIALLINTVRRLYQAETWLREGKWVGEGPFAVFPARPQGRPVRHGPHWPGNRQAAGAIQGGDRLSYPQQARWPALYLLRFAKGDGAGCRHADLHRARHP
jgi:lactate dehydrogenase-like 2-hydroxyacid dehydrogenase